MARNENDEALPAPLASDWLPTAEDLALERVRWGEGSTFNVDDFTWSEVRGPDSTPCFGMIGSGPRIGDLCMRMAGAGTEHPGLGTCSRHGGNTATGRREAAWVLAHRFAQELQVTPWEALLKAVRIAAGKVAFIEMKLSEAVSDEQFKPPGTEVYPEYDGRPTSADAMVQTYEENEGGNPPNLFYWVKQSELWHDKLVRVSKAAIDAGVAERLVRQIELEAQLMLRAANLTLDELGLDDDRKQLALTSMAQHMLRLESEEMDDERVIDQ